MEEVKSIVYRIDGNLCGSEPSVGLGYFSSREKAEWVLESSGFYLEKRKWSDVADHQYGSDSIMWYDKRLSDEGYEYDNTHYAIITEIKVKVN